jgi:hypothetical protein
LLCGWWEVGGPESVPQDHRLALNSVLATSEVIPSRAMRALEGEGRGLSHLEGTARGGGCGAS